MSPLRALSALLAVQLVLVAFMLWPEDRAALAPRPLLEIDAGSIQEITVTRKAIDEAPPDTVRLVRVADGWEIATSGGYPATPDKVDDLVEHLLGIEVRAPIATQATSYDTLKVGEDEYGRRVKVRAADEEIELVVGTAASKSIYVRVEGLPEVYQVSGLSEWSLRDRDASYYDSQIVKADPDALITFSVLREQGDLLFTRGEEGWQLEGLEDGAVVDATKVESFIADATDLRLTRPVGREVAPEHGLDSGVRVEWSYEDDNQTVVGGFTIGADDGNESYLQAAGSEFVVRASNTKLDPLREKTAADFAAPAADG